MDKNEKKERIIKTGVFITGVVIILILLGIWTENIYRAREMEELRSALESIISERGEKGLFDLAGIPTDEMNYGSLSLYLNDRGAWTFDERERRDIAAYDKAKVSTVQIISSSDLSDESQASGVIIRSDGYIVTNRHVLGDAKVFSVNFYDGASADASLVGFDDLTDLAVIKTEREGLVPITFSEYLPTVGSRALSIGMPYGYTFSLSSGIVSGLERTLFTQDGMVIPNLIQIDNLINPGNSGGPLLDSRGEMTGLISSIYSTSGSAQGLSFAIPSETVKRISSAIIESGGIKRGMIDAYLVELNPQLVSYMDLSVSQGLLVSQTERGGNAERAGLRGGNNAAQYGNQIIYLGGDVITEINGRRIRNWSDYFSSLFGLDSSEEVTLTIQRGSRRINERVVLSEMNSANMRYIIR